MRMMLCLTFVTMCLATICAGQDSGQKPPSISDPKPLLPGRPDAKVGLIAARYSLGMEINLTQQAIIRSTDTLYYIIDLTVAAPKDGKIEEDPNVKLAVQTFNQMLDTVKILDQTAIRDEQTQR